MAPLEFWRAVTCAWIRSVSGVRREAPGDCPNGPSRSFHQPGISSLSDELRAFARRELVHQSRTDFRYPTKRDRLAGGNHAQHEIRHEKPGARRAPRAAAPGFEMS